MTNIRYIVLSDLHFGEVNSVLTDVDPARDPARTTRLRVNALAEALAESVRALAYANDDGKIVCFFQSADKFKSRYATFGFNQAANLDQGAMWPTSFALTELTPKEEAKIGALVKKAVR